MLIGENIYLKLCCGKIKKSPSFESTVVGDPHYRSMGTQLAEKEGREEKGQEQDINDSSDSDEWESFTSESESDETRNPLLKTPCNNKKSNKRVGLTNRNETKLKKKKATSKCIKERKKENIRKNETKQRKETEVKELQIEIYVLVTSPFLPLRLQPVSYFTRCPHQLNPFTTLTLKKRPEKRKEEIEKN